MCQQHISLARLALALELRVNPTKLKLSRQACSELRGQTWKQESEAGGIENAGSVLSPENGIVVVIRITRVFEYLRKPTFWSIRKAAVLTML